MSGPKAVQKQQTKSEIAASLWKMYSTSRQGIAKLFAAANAQDLRKEHRQVEPRDVYYYMRDNLPAEQFIKFARKFHPEVVSAVPHSLG